MKDHVPQFAFVHELTAFWAAVEVLFFCVAQLIKISCVHFWGLESRLFEIARVLVRFDQPVPQATQHKRF
jgi:hypothetical protein